MKREKETMTEQIRMVMTAATHCNYKTDKNRMWYYTIITKDRAW